MSSYLLRTPGPLLGLARSQSLSPARLIFLISLVVFFTVLFVVSYVWMRKPQFGQHQGHVQPGASGRPADHEGQSSPDTDAGREDPVVPRVHTVDRPS
jgi:hypothetical protein